MFKEITIQQYLENGLIVPVIDVRSPKEFNHAHIPGAVNLPLFDDAERAIIGITYKNEGKEVAILKGLEIVGPKMNPIVQKVLSSEFRVGSNPGDVSQNNKSFIMHCWRGGMRSKSMATLFDFAGINTKVLKGGYKAYRNEVRKIFSLPYNIIILGGRTGSAKTKILYELKKLGEQIIDLEKLANHKGSAFGDLGEDLQPSTEMFENLFYDELKKLNPKKRIWIEDESHLIGTVFIPEEFWTEMRKAIVIYCDFPINERINFLVNTYGDFNKDGVINSVNKITKRLGGQHAKAALEYYEAGNLHEATKIVLVYYDKSYDHGLGQRKQENIHKIELLKINPENNAIELINYLNQKLIAAEPLKKEISI